MMAKMGYMLAVERLEQQVAKNIEILNEQIDAASEADKGKLLVHRLECIRALRDSRDLCQRKHKSNPVVERVLRATVLRSPRLPDGGRAA